MISEKLGGDILTHKKKNRARRERQRLTYLKRNLRMPYKGLRQEFAPPIKVVKSKMGKGGQYNRQKWKRGADLQLFFVKCSDEHFKGSSFYFKAVFFKKIKGLKWDSQV